MTADTVSLRPIWRFFAVAPRSTTVTRSTGRPVIIGCAMVPKNAGCDRGEMSSGTSRHVIIRTYATARAPHRDGRHRLRPDRDRAGRDPGGRSAVGRAPAARCDAAHHLLHRERERTDRLSSVRATAGGAAARGVAADG